MGTRRRARIVIVVGRHLSCSLGDGGGIRRVWDRL